MSDRIESAYPLTPGQGGILFHAVSGDKPGAYIVQIVIEISGPFDHEKSNLAWDQLVARHEALRTAFVWRGQRKPIQVVGRRAKLARSRADLSSMDPDAQKDHISAWLVQDRQEGFDLNSAPLARVTHFELGNGRHQLVFTFHHLILDGWSIPILLKDWMALYASARLLDPVSLRGHLAWLHNQDDDAAKAFWREEIGTHSFGIMDRLPAPQTPPTSRRGDLSVSLDTEETHALGQSLRPYGITLATAVQGAWSIALGKLSGQTDVVYGLARSGRPPALPGAEQRVGMFLNTLPVLAHLDLEDSASGLLAKLQKSVQSQNHFEHVPLAEVQSMHVSRGRAMFDSAVVFENYPTAKGILYQLPGLRIDALEVYEQTSLPLTLFASGTSELRLRLLFDAESIAETAAQTLLIDLRSILLSISTAPGTQLKEFGLSPQVISATGATSVKGLKEPSFGPAETAKLGEIWADILGLSEMPSAQESFFDLGGHSILVISLQDRVRTDFGHEVEIADLFRFATLSQQASMIAANARGESNALSSSVEERIQKRASGRDRLVQRRNRRQGQGAVAHV
ncbi:MAG: condensation domain-containing protein [Pseudomonadota bacterium]